MAYYLEIKFFGTNEKWQRNPNPFSSWDEADRAGLQFVADHRPDTKMEAELYRLTRDPQFAPNTVNVEYRVVGG
jgi:hypothetical protein